MRIALDAGSEIGQRTARILLSDDRCNALLMTTAGWKPDDHRAIRSRDLTGVDVVISDGTTPLSNLIGLASVAGTPLVAWPDAASSDHGPAAIPVVVGANVGSTLAEALLTHPASSPEAGDTIQVAWTEPGKPLRRGTPIGFPEPVGMSWAEERGSGRFVAFREDEWAAATTMVEGPSGQRTVGVADHGAHLEALTLAAVGFVAASGAFTTGIQPAIAAGSPILAEVRDLELDVAVWRSHS